MRTVEENKALLEKYPILRQRNVYTGEPIDNNDEYTYLDAMPQGWAKAFGIPMFEDIQTEVNTWSKEEQEHFFFTDIKEKFGELRVYTSHMTDKLGEILEAYCAISRNVCIICGKLDFPKDIVNTLTFISGNKGKEVKKTIDISEYVKKVREYNAVRS